MQARALEVLVLALLDVESTLDDDTLAATGNNSSTAGICTEWTLTIST